MYFLLFLCWGSFLNVLAYRMLEGYDWVKLRSFCTGCKRTIAWYDLIPVFSWLLLRAQCRYCKAFISWLYPFIELLTALSFLALYWYVDPRYWLGYGVLFSALIVTIRTDIETFFILRMATLGIMPIGIVLSIFNALPVTVAESIGGALVGYCLLWLARWLFYRLLGQEGMGQGDLDLLAAIGAFIGPLGVWCCLVLGSLLGSLIGIILLSYKGYYSRFFKIPFGPFLAVGAMVYILAQPTILSVILQL
ncbi:MAG TPA: prepilin peptidase [Candidatus Babeliaceae bacterium]|nr:prepilin peptidase [Candidatus Babeliaceae bacterium]